MPDEEGRRPDVQGGGPAGQQEQWLRLYARYHGKVRGYFAGQVKCAQDVDDLVQEVFANVFRHGYDMHHPEAYLCTMARHHLCTYRNRKERSARTEHKAADCNGWTVRGMDYDADSDPLEELTRREMQVMVRTILTRLTPTLAEALRLRFLEGLRIGAAAARAGCGRDTLSRRLQRATCRFLHLWEKAYLR
jgi:RNA polymerase sigma factor (sigma-70 family)